MQQIRDARIGKIGVRIDERGNRATRGILRPEEDRGGPGGFHLAPIPRIRQKAQRTCVRMQEEGLFVEPLVIRYLNRLSDYFFELARYTAYLLRTEELSWQPRV